MINRHILLASASAAIFGASPAWGLGTVGAAQDQDVARPSESTAPAATETDDEIKDIVVTAQKREQALQTVPIAITALTGRELTSAGATGTRDLATLTPGLTVTNIGGTGTPGIRGVGQRSQSPGDEPSVPVYVDGVYQSTSFSALFSFNSIERIEVLKGPQGTLFGRNALGGAINIITRQPSFDAEAKADISYGTSDEIQGNIYASTPVADTLAVNVAYHHDSRDGYIPNVVTGKNKGKSNSDAVRAKMLWQPSDRFDLTAGVTYVRSSDDTTYSGYPLDGNTIAKRLNPAVVIPEPGKTAVGLTYFKMRQYGAFAVSNINFDTFRLTATVGWADTRAKFRSDSDITALDYAFAKGAYTDKSTQAEIRASSVGDNPIDWIVGAFYFNARSAYPIDGDGNLFMNRAAPTGALSAVTSDARAKAYALFGEATWHVTDKLALTGGVRYSSEDRTKLNHRRSTTPASALPPGVDFDYTIGDIVAPVLTNPSGAKKSFSNLSFRATVQYDFSDRVHSFATFSQGFKSGFFNATSAPPFAALEPETVNNYEAGVKSDISNKLRINITGFYLDYKNIQVTARTALGSDLFNAASATNYGGELQLEWRPLSGVTVKSGVAYQHARYGSFPNAVTYFTATSTDAALTNPCVQGTGTPIGGNRTATCDSAGKPLARTPDWTANLTVGYKFDLLGGNAEVGATGYYSSDFIWDLYGTLPQGGAYTTFNAYGTIASLDGKYSVTVFSNNLFDKKYDINRFQGPAGTSAIPARGRTVGLRLAADF